MERREAPGRCATAPLWGPGALRRTPQRALQGRACEARPEARACDDLEVCETSPPKRCASRRSTGRRIAPHRRPRGAGLISGPASRPARCHGSPHESGTDERAVMPSAIRAVLAAGITFFEEVVPALRARCTAAGELSPACGRGKAISKRLQILHDRPAVFLAQVGPVFVAAIAVPLAFAGSTVNVPDT